MVFDLKEKSFVVIIKIANIEEYMTLVARPKIDNAIVITAKPNIVTILLSSLKL